MSAPHFFVERLDGEVVRLTGDEARHAVRALRIRAGEQITVSDGRGGVVRARVDTVDPSVVAASIVEQWSVPAPVPVITVCPAIPKSGRLDIEVQKLTEIGVDAIRPWPAVRSVPRWDRAKAARQGERLRAIAREAAKQSRRVWLPDVADPAPLDDPAGTVVVLHEEASERLRDVWPPIVPSAVTLVTGPEGGLTPEEIDDFRAEGAVVASIGPTVLRAETAAIVAGALVLARFGRIG